MDPACAPDISIAAARGPRPSINITSVLSLEGDTGIRSLSELLGE